MPTMAPDDPLDALDASLKAAIHSLYTLQSSTHGYLGPETQSALVANASSLVTALQNVATTARSLPSALPFRPELTPPAFFGQLPGEVVGYVDAARNPDIYTREFVEMVQRRNAYLRGKGEALAGLRDALAEEIGAEWPEMKAVVAKVVAGEGDGIKPEELDKALGSLDETRVEAESKGPDGAMSKDESSKESKTTEEPNGLKQEDVKMEFGT